MAKDRKPYDKAHGRVYKGPDGDYAKFQSSEKAKKDRASRNKARAEATKQGKVKKGDKKDIDHKNSDPRDNSPGNLRVMSASKNRGRTKNGKKV